MNWRDIETVKGNKVCFLNKISGHLQEYLLELDKGVGDI